VPQLIAELRKQGSGDIVVTVGGIIPPKDYKMLETAGVKAIFGPGTQIPAAARKVLELLTEIGR
jgi:methylmalonyl-CoA mutase